MSEELKIIFKKLEHCSNEKDMFHSVPISLQQSYLLLNYIKQLESQLQEKEKIIEDAIEYGKSYMPNYNFDHYNLEKLISILERK